MTPDFVPALAVPAAVLAVEMAVRLDFRGALAGYTAAMRDSTDVIRSTTLSDAEKQKLMARGSAAMLRGTGLLFVIVAATLGSFIAVIWGGALMLGTPGGGMAALLRVDVQIVALLCAIAWYRMRPRVFV
jgi:hypothetical protein